MPSSTPGLYIGCAGWSIPCQHAQHFPAQGTHLERYAQRLPAVEINSSFYRPHRPATYARWAVAVPDYFRFAVKVPREITHSRRLRESAEPLERFVTEALALGVNLGPLLVQLPPSLRYDRASAEPFFTDLRSRFSGGIVCEPRHVSWFSAPAEQLLVDAQIARVAADPAVVPQAAVPGGWPGLVYYRLHGSPEIYNSDYPAATLEALAQTLRLSAQGAPTWCIFDNTALGAATANALDVWARLQSSPIPDGDGATIGG